MSMSFPMHTPRIRSHLTKCLITTLQPTKHLPQTAKCTPRRYASYSTKGGSGPANTLNTRTVKSSRDSTTSPSSPSARYRRAGGQGQQQTTSDLRKSVMDEVAIPGRFQQYFRPDKRATRKAEGSVLSMDQSRSPKKVSAAKWNRYGGDEKGDSEGGVADVVGVETNDKVIADGKAEGSRPTHSGSSNGASRRGFDNVGWRALEETYARDVLPHPYFHQDYLNITEIKLLPDRKTFQLWYRPQPDDRVSASDRKADMSDLWKKLEDEVDLHSDSGLDIRSSSKDNADIDGGEKQEVDRRNRGGRRRQ
ncbi:hypothetical protein BGX24_009974 [Mortierella sp. AD032]|nr:hypothetical protein BGX24_009974 [Mortierella sp. AD032]